jgi:Ca-activated chloride channel family protein
MWLLLLWVGAMQGARGAEHEAGLTVQAADGSSQVLAATQTEVAIDVAGMVAHARVQQHFLNPGDAFLEGHYRLPLPADSAVFAMRIVLDGRVIESEIREREAARIEYAAARSAGMTTALIEQAKVDLFATRIANIPPRSEVSVEIEYFQQIAFHDGQFGLVLPLTIRPRYADDSSDEFAGALAALDEVPVASPATALTLPVSIQVALAPGIKVQPPTSPSHAVSVQKDGAGFAVALLDAQSMPDRDFVLVWSPMPNQAPSLASFSETVDGAQYLSIMVVPPSTRGARLSRELVVVLDSSGSMSGAAFEAAQNAAKFALSTLQAGDFVNIVDFDSTANAMTARSLPVDAASLDQARAFIDTRVADGGTEIAGALDLANALPEVGERLRQIVFITDGAVGNEGAIYQRMAYTDGAARLFMVGIGAAPNRAFLRRAAELGRGVATVIESMDEIEPRLQALFRKIDTPQLTKVAITWPEHAESFPKRVPDLYAGEPLWLTTRVATNASGKQAAVGLKARAGGGWLDASFDIDRATPAVGLAKLWAQRKIAALEDGLALGDNPELVRNDVLATALAHRLVSKYTSFVAVEKVVRRAEAAPLASAEFANLAPNDTVAFANTALGWRAQLLLGVLMLLAGVLLHGRMRQ